MKRFSIALAAALLSTSAAWAQGYPDIWTSEVEPAVQGANKLKGFSFGVRVETWRADLEITDSSPSGLENNVDDPQVMHNALLFTGAYDVQVGPNLTITLFAGIGPEYIATRLGLDTGGWLDTTFDYHMVFEAGANIAVQINNLDVGGGFVLRTGTEAEVEADDNQDLTYFYFLFRIQGEVGYRLRDGIRGYGGLRFSLYNADWENDDANADFEAEFDLPIGFFLGAEVGTGAVRGRFEFSVLDAYGFLAAITWTF